MGLAALALTLRAAVPLGFMPVFAGPGTVRVEICTAQGLAYLNLPAQGEDGKHAPSADAPCAFALLTPTIAAAGVDLPLPPVIGDSGRRFTPPALFVAALIKPWTAQGPPFSA